MKSSPQKDSRTGTREDRSLSWLRKIAEHDPFSLLIGRKDS
jgi:hypothetical protein